MRRRLDIGMFLGLLIGHIEQVTGVTCEADPDGVESPLYSVELLGTKPANTKTMYIDVAEVRIHCISEAIVPYSAAPALEMVSDLEEALSDGFSMPPPYKLNNVVHDGLQAIKKDESGEGHAVLSFHFHICYGFAVKQV